VTYLTKRGFRYPIPNVPTFFRKIILKVKAEL
jgi:hypothetical protein